MKKALKRRFIFSAMLSFLIVILLLIGSIVLINYQEDTRKADAFLRALLDADTRLMQSPPPSWFGYQFTQDSFPAGFYTITANARGEILEIDQIGILQNEANLDALTTQIVLNQLTEGKAGSYQFRASYRAEDGMVRMVLLDRTIQMLSLFNILKIGAIVGLVCLAVLFLILQPIAGHLANEWLRKTEQQKQFITNAGHELKTPVAIILSNTEALELMEGKNKYSRNIYQQTQRMNQLIQQLLMIARLDELRWQSKATMLNFSTLVQESCDAFSESLDLRCDIQANCHIRGHKESLRQMMDVLLDNALQHGRLACAVELQLRTVGKHLELVIQNQADKLPSCRPEDLFERFFRGDTSHSRSQKSGCGVGLSAAKAIVKLHHGNIRIEYTSPDIFEVRISFHVCRM